MLAARTPESYRRLRRMFHHQQVIKQYQALVAGRVLSGGLIQSGIRAMPADPSRVQVLPLEQCTAQDQRRLAQSRFRPLQALGPFTWVEVVCPTGRRHQVRAHMAFIGHPLVGDASYGGPPFPPPLPGATPPSTGGAFLHASRLELLELRLEFSAPLPDQRRLMLETLSAPSGTTRG
jgi:23S rRNA pseudouridine1911/1915/1917 synthase